MTAQNLPYEPEFEQAYKGMSKTTGRRSIQVFGVQSIIWVTT